MWSMIPIILFSLVASASPVDHSLSLARRDFCDGVDAMPVLYHEYGSDKCKPKYSLSDDGVCRHTSYGENRCAAFCQVRTTFFYGREQPFPNTFCHGPETCTITSTHTRTVGWSLTISPQVQEALKVGVSGGFSGSSADAVAHSYSIKLESGQCGYFTFVPVVKSVCGSLSTQNPRVMFTPLPVYWCINKFKTTGNVCGDELRLNPDGSVDGETIFVRTNCENRMPLPAKDQDAVYRKPGVPMDRGTQEAWADTWGKEDLTDAEDDTEVKCETGDGSPKIEDCTHAFHSPMMYPDMQAQRGKKGNSYWAGYVHSCAITLEYDSDWDEDSCGITNGDVVVAAYTIADKCSDTGKGLVGGSRKFGKDKCKAQLKIKHTEGLPPSPL